MPALLDIERAPRLSALLKAIPAGLVQGVCADEGINIDPKVAGIGSLATAGKSEISFIAHSKYLDQLLHTQAGIVIVLPEINKVLSEKPESTNNSFVRVVCPHPYLLYARIAQWFDWAREPAFEPGVHTSALIDPLASIHRSASIGPNVVVGRNSVIGAMTRIEPGCVIGANVSIGESSTLHARVTIYDGVQIGARAIVHSGAVLGADGFGFAPDPTLGKGAWGKIPQLGKLIIGDDVEIGANTTIDRGALENTIIEDGVKLDNQIMIAHNCKIGAHTAMAACVGIAGSTTVGQRCTIGGASMLSGHLILGDDVHISGGTAVTANVLKPGRYTGVFPFGEHGEWQRNAAVITQLAQLRKRLRTIERNN
jgi:UDP-3-O-[3-hydroxymyristoyl] glucosamine N-acyltransferase